VACGAIIASDAVAPSLRPGMHASTFGGNPLAMAAGIATVQTIEEDGLLENCREASARFSRIFGDLRAELPIIRDLRVCGAMIGIDLAVPATPAVSLCMERGLLVNATHDTVLRLLPPINITGEQVAEGCEIIGDVLKQMASAT
jgi:acetylornithine/N-succinyldiaminopimelate aminotransferase